MENTAAQSQPEKIVHERLKVTRDPDRERFELRQGLDLRQVLSELAPDREPSQVPTGVLANIPTRVGLAVVKR